MSGERRGRSRELDVMHRYRDEGWVAYRLAWGNADVLAMRLEPNSELEHEWMRVLLIQVKSTSGGPYERFGPRDRERLVAEADSCGAEAVLAWWPPHGVLQLFDAHDWPQRALLEASAL
jgi:Holliday junction resolvase